MRLAPVGQSHHSGNHATLTNGDRLVRLDGGVVEVRAISYSDFGSGVTDEFGGNHPSNKPNPVSQPNCAFIFDAHGTISVDTSASFTVSEKDCAANEGYDAAKRMAGISLKALEGGALRKVQRLPFARRQRRWRRVFREPPCHG